MAAKTLPSRDLLRQLLRYNSETGVFTWLPRPKSMFAREQDYLTWNTRFAHTAAGVISRYRNGYQRSTISIFGIKYFAHRLAWIWCYGTEPAEIDHIDGNPLNNRIANLRSATRSEQLYNTRISTRNSSGIKGITWDKNRARWMVKIRFEGQCIQIGRFASLGEAARARREAAIRLHGEFAKHV